MCEEREDEFVKRIVQTLKQALEQVGVRNKVPREVSLEEYQALIDQREKPIIH